MRLRIRHETTYTYEKPAGRALENLRLTPRGHDTLFVHDWRIDIDRDCRLAQSTDAFGNIMHRFTVEGPLESVTVVAEGTVETVETSGALVGTVERFPTIVFLRETALTAPHPDLAAFAEKTTAAEPNTLARMHALMAAIHAAMRFDGDATDSRTTAVEAFQHGHGVCQDFAHVFLACARHLGVPARYVSGYMLRVDGNNDQEAGHAWAEALVDDLGWVGFDPTNGISSSDAHVRVAVGLDYLGAAPVRGAQYGGDGEKLAVRVQVANVGRSPG